MTEISRQGSFTAIVRRSRIATFSVLAFMLLFSGVSISNTVLAQGFCDGVDLSPSAPHSEASSSPAAALAASFPDDGGALTVFAAASLTDAFAEIATTLESRHPGLAITIVTGGSQTLVTQLIEGAHADVLATANTSTMATAVDAGLVASDPVVFTANRLVIVTPIDNPAGITSLNDLAQSGVKLVMANPDVPVGKYAQQAICTYASTSDAPGEFADTMASNIVSREEDVRSVLAKVQLGEADAGIVYASDAIAAAKAGAPVHVIEFPANLPITATYPIAPVSGGDSTLANAWIATILSPEGQAVLADYGFGYQAA